MDAKKIGLKRHKRQSLAFGGPGREGRGGVLCFSICDDTAEQDLEKSDRTGGCSLRQTLPLSNHLAASQKVVGSNPGLPVRVCGLSSPQRQLRL